MLTGEPERKLRAPPPQPPGAACSAWPEPPCTPPGISDSQSCTAALNAGELSLSFSCSMWTPPPENVGSGKLGTPWERMHAAALRYCSCCAGRQRSLVARSTAGQELATGLFGRLELRVLSDAGGNRHLDAGSAAVFADFRLGEVGHPVRVHAGGVRDRLAGRATLRGLRSRRPRRTSRRSASRRVRPRLATPPFGDPPPQPARSRPASRSPAAAQAAPRRRSVIVLRSSSGAASSGMLSPSQLVSALQLLVRHARFRERIDAAAGVGETAPKPPGASLPSVRVLVIEDDEEMAEAVAFGLRQTGMAVDVALDGPAGLAPRARERLRRDRARPRPAGDARRRAVREARGGASVAAGC